jgi:hypothetical protein
MLAANFARECSRELDVWSQIQKCAPFCEDERDCAIAPRLVEKFLKPGEARSSVLLMTLTERASVSINPRLALPAAVASSNLKTL